MKKEYDFEIGNLREMFNNVVSKLNSTDMTLRSEINAIKNETMENFSASKKLLHDSYVVCRKEINQTRSFYNAEFMRVNESLTNRLNALDLITSDIANLKVSNEILTNSYNVIQRLYPDSCETMEKSGEYKIYPSSHPNGINVFCYKDSTNRGWIVIQRRADGSVNFNRTWADYKDGFGNLSSDFWLGNEHIYQLTKNKKRELRIDMETFDGNKTYALYSMFNISSESEKYKLHVAGYSGDAGNGLATKVYGNSEMHNGHSFSTFDADNDLATHTCCSCHYGGGWWFTSCFNSNLNAEYFKKKTQTWYGVTWQLDGRWPISLKFVAMKVR
ncbi:fibroleukin-like [Dreissena polymorpha]|nr:fibroleukin-like [Dreissena polymorpha]